MRNYKLRVEIFIDMIDNATEFETCSYSMYCDKSSLYHIKLKSNPRGTLDNQFGHYACAYHLQYALNNINDILLKVHPSNKEGK